MIARILARGLAHSLAGPPQLRTLLATALTLLALLITLVVSYTIGRGGVDRVEREIGLSLAMLADQMQDKLDRGLFERAREINNLAEVLSLAGQRLAPDEIRSLLEQMQVTYPDYAWIGVADGAGKVVLGTKGQLEGEDVSRESWFRIGRDRAHVGDVHEGGHLGERLPLPHADRAHFIDVTAPATMPDGSKGVLGAYLNWSWAREVQDSLFGSMGTSQHIEVMVLSKRGTVLLGPPEIVGKAISLGIMRDAPPGTQRYAVERWPEGASYLSGYAVSDGYRQFGGLGWSILVREPADEALAPVAALRQQMLAWSASFVALSALLAWLLASRLTAPLLRLATAADQVRRGAPADVPHVGGYAEAEMLSNSLRTLIDTLKARETSLSDLNTSLERQVEDRTRELADQNLQLAAAKEEAERATQSKSRFLAAASHDLRQPLHALTLFARALSRRVEGAETKGLVAQTEQALASLKEMFDALLHVSRLDAGLIEPQLQEVSVAAVLERLAPGFRAEAEHRGLRFHVHSLDAVVRTDPVLLETMMRNLLSNALKFTRRGGVLLAARRRPGGVAIEIYDTGPGIEEAQLGRIFQEFERTTRTATGVNDGLGLGLSIVMRYARLLGIGVDVASRPERGTRFRVLLPEVIGARQDSATPAAASQAGPASLAGRRILVLDDEPLIVESLSRDLSDRGAEVLRAGSTAEAEAQIAAGRLPDVLVVDINLTSLETGPQFVERMQRQYGRAIPALVLTGATDAATLAGLMRSGRRWLTKPANPEAIAGLIGEIIAEAAAKPQSAA